MLLAAIAALSYAFPSPGSSEIGGVHSNPPGFIAAWNSYVSDTKAGARHGLQSDCIPRRFAATNGTAFRGTAVLFHGFTACPQQYFQLAKLLAATGYDVLLPLLPGHGNTVTGASNQSHVQRRQLSMGGTLFCVAGCLGSIDDVEGLPTEPGGYQMFVDRINAIVLLSSGMRVVAGLSVGASLAAAAGQAVDGSGRALYTRQLILSPMLRLASALEDLTVTTLNRLRLGREFYLGGPGCYAERDAQGGRAGFCSYKFAQGAAARDFGLATLANLTAPNGTTVAVLYDQADDVVSTAKVCG